jgi:hypothetical protein
MPIRNEIIPLAQLLPDERNPRSHNPENIKRLASRILAVGFTAPVLVVEETGILAAGHRRRLALEYIRNELHRPEPDGIESGWGVPARIGSWSEIQALQVLTGDNGDVTELEYDTEALTALLAELEKAGELEGSGYDEARLDALIDELAGTDPLDDGTGGGSSSSADPEAARKTLAERFGVPPFSVLDARQGYWQERKRAWIALGIQSELGRGENAGSKLTMSDTVNALKPCADQALKNSRANAAPGGAPRGAAQHR